VEDGADTDPLRHRIEELERYAAVVAHELLTPVVMIDAYAATLAERLADGRHPDELRDLAALRRASARARLLAETLLQQARSDGRAPRLRPLEVGALVADCVALLEPEIRAHHAEVRVGEMPTVDGEEPLIAAVFTNLIGNALRYGPRQGATVEVTATQEPGAWRFVVHNEGQAIPPEERERIFRPFERGRGERRADGSGLGLAICRQIVERHRGEIAVTTVEDGDTVFTFTLPS
jgi:signal transduction histidine kinase